MALNVGGSRTALSEINVTPMVDVMLVLLVMFMVTAPLMQQGVDLELPRAKAQQLSGDDELIVLSVTQDKRIFLGKTELPYEQLRAKLTANRKLGRDRELYLHADRRLEYGFVVDVMAILKDAGVDKLGMVTDPTVVPPGS